MNEHTFRVAACQMVSTPRVDENLRTADRLIGEAARDGAALVGLPEYFCLMGHDEADKVRYREPLADPNDPHTGGPIQGFLADAARRHRVWLVGGTVPLAASDANKVLNTTLVFNPQGQRVAQYDKIHLFSFSKGNEFYDEARTIAPGGRVGVFDAPCGRVGLSICYDLRFPELYRAMGAQFGDIKLVLVPAAFTYTTGSAHWEVLLRARAIENQCYVLAPAQGGSHENGRRTWGHSMLIDPWGKVLAVKPEGEGIVIGDVDLVSVESMRASLPALRHRTM
ncbi:MAG TPA: carbon-nitrogen hydrolase family protein [Burkholderiaceae bacterium]|nr:carbon-nitrogen hydrolase family protein [Burkholderiaceae bacterium]